MIERDASLAGKTTLVADDHDPTRPLAPGDFDLPGKGIDLRRAVDEFETNLIDQALARTGGNKNQAAMLLSLNRTTLVEKLRKRRRRLTQE